MFYKLMVDHVVHCSLDLLTAPSVGAMNFVKHLMKKEKVEEGLFLYLLSGNVSTEQDRIVSTRLYYKEVCGCVCLSVCPSACSLTSISFACG